jgi:transposase-like protein
MGFPAAYRAKLHLTNLSERLDGEIEQRTEVVGIFSDEPARSASWSAQSCLSRTTSGPCNAADT